MHMVGGVLGLNLDDDRQPRLAVQDERCQEPPVPGGPSTVSPSKSPSRSRSSMTSGRLRMRAASPVRKPCFSSRQQPALAAEAWIPQCLRSSSPLDPGIDRLRRNRTVVFLLFQPARDLLRRPLLGQSGANGVVDFGIVHLPREGTLSPPPHGLLLRAGARHSSSLPWRCVRSSRPIVAGLRPAKDVRDLLPVRVLMPQLCYAIPLFQRKMTCHRWDSVPKEKVATPLPLEQSQRCFSATSFEAHFSSLDCI